MGRGGEGAGGEFLYTSFELVLGETVGVLR